MQLTAMLLQIFQAGSGDIITDIWNIMKAHPTEAVAIFLIVFIGLVLFFAFVIHHMSPYILIVIAVIALTALLLYRIYQSNSSSMSSML
jgi:Flp pilus assembly protein TadB